MWLSGWPYAIFNKYGHNYIGHKHVGNNYIVIGHEYVGDNYIVKSSVLS